METTYVDLHIHTYKDANKRQGSYDLATLIAKIRKVSSSHPILLSLTDHNTINKQAYEELLQRMSSDPLLHFIIGVELHVRNFEKCSPYHCHFFFDSSIDEIDELNDMLNELYPNKLPNDDDQSIPRLDQLINKFNKKNFLVLPHGGQSHKTFDESIPKEGVVFDTLLEKNLYYNMFDGFTARSDKGLDKTISYFKKLGIEEIINLVTCTDNYSPTEYPSDKNDSENFVPTWMYSEPTFNGLRLALGENSRLVYSQTPPKKWAEYIESVKLENEKIKIDINLTPGLNVVMGGSSSGKTLLVDSIYNKLKFGFAPFPAESQEKYSKFGVKDIGVTHASATVPHYLNQNYISKVISANGEPGIESIEILKNTFKIKEEVLETITKTLSNLNGIIDGLVGAIESNNANAEQIRKMAIFPRLIVGDSKPNPFETFKPNQSTIDAMKFSDYQHDEMINNLTSILKFANKNPFFNDVSKDIENLKKEIDRAYQVSLKEKAVRTIVEQAYKDFSAKSESDSEKRIKREQQKTLLGFVRAYKESRDLFFDRLNELSSFDFHIKSEEEEANGHKLTISNELLITKASILEAFNCTLKKPVSKFDYFEPTIFEVNKLKARDPKLTSYKELKDYLKKYFSDMNKVKYSITTNEGKAFSSLSPGWKTAIILDIILGYSKDFAPIIIDQPEDNLAAEYINNVLVKSIKEAKLNRQIIIVTHSATIPMLADAQNIILCESDSDRIRIQSSSLEGNISGINTVDQIVKIMDGGKISVKKRIKKYDLKKIIANAKEEEKVAI